MIKKSGSNAVMAGLFILLSGACSFMPRTHTVTYNANGADSGTLSKSMEIRNSGETISTAPTGISRTGYTLSGWNTKADGSGTMFLFGTTKVVSDLTIFAQWLKLAAVSNAIFDNALKDGFVAEIKSDKETRGASLDTTIDAGSTEGGASIKIDLSADSNWGGGYVQNVNGIDASSYTSLSFAINLRQLDAGVDYMLFKLEDMDGGTYETDLYALTASSTDGDWDTYVIDISGTVTGVNLAKFKAIGLWHPTVGGSGGNYKPGTFFIDDIKFTGTETHFTSLVWSDEFDGSAINTANWTYDLGTGSDKGLTGWGNNELQYYTERSENARIEDLPGGGRGLVIEALKENYSGSAYTSARLLTQGLQSWTYGRIEARIKLPIGQGIWPAFWMLGNNIDTVKWPACGEIDIMEYKGQEPGKVHGTIHYGEPHTYTGKEYTLPNGEKFSDDFHVFAIEWHSGEICWYVDGVKYSTQREWSSSVGDYPSPFDKPFFILLNLAVGGNFLGPPDDTTRFPQKMYVDWVRVYQ